MKQTVTLDVAKLHAAADAVMSGTHRVIGSPVKADTITEIARLASGIPDLEVTAEMRRDIKTVLFVKMYTTPRSLKDIIKGILHK